MDRRRLTGVALILTSAAGFGSGSLFAQPVYGAGVDWLVLSAWRFLFGVLSTFVAIQTFYAGAQRIGAAQAALISTVEPIWTIALAAILFAVALTPVQLLGGALILIGVVIAQTGQLPSGRGPAVRVADE